MTPPFASSRILRANGSASVVALPAPGVVRALSLSACLGIYFLHPVFEQQSFELSLKDDYSSDVFDNC